MTNVQLTYHLYHSWEKEENISVLGSAFYHDELLKGESLIHYFKSSASEETFITKLKELSGHFAVVIELPEIVFAAVDRIRTFPLVVIKQQKKILITDHFTQPGVPDEEQIENFKKVYCTLENKTLLKDVLQLQAGEYLSVNKKNSFVKIDTYYHHGTEKTIHENENVLVKKLHTLELNMVQRAIRYASNRTILIPLSGGYDSRYILALLKENKYEKVECYTYGRKESYEVLIARNVAEKLNIKWHFIEYTDELMNAFFSKQWKSYSDLNHHYTSLPHEQDFFALQYLKENDLLPHDAVMMNGFCQDIHAGSFLEPIKNFDLAKFIAYKYQLTPELREYENSWNGYQEWLIKNRLSKFIINSVRVYEYFGLDFYLPFWDAQWISYWYSLEPKLRLHQEFYREYLLKTIFEKYGIGFKKPMFDVVNRLYSLKKIAKSILPRQISEHISHENSKSEKNDPNNTLFLYQLIYDKMEVKPEVRDYKINNLMALYFLDKLKEKHEL